MVSLDYILLAFILVWALLGMKKGFLMSLGSMIGLVLAVLVASRFFPIVSGWIGGTNFSNIIAFIIIFSISIKLVSLVFWILGKIFEIVTILPFISTFNRLLGLILGLAQGIFVLSVLTYFVAKYPVNDWLLWQMSISPVADVLFKIAMVFVPLFPEAVKSLQSIM